MTGYKQKSWEKIKWVSTLANEIERKRAGFEETLGNDLINYFMKKFMYETISQIN